MLHYFNPGHETAVLNSSVYYTVPANVALMRRELAFLPAWYARENDLVLVNNDSDKLFRTELLCHFESLPIAVTQNELIDYPSEEVFLWGISPESIHFFERLNLENGLKLQLPLWHEEYRYLNSRKCAADCLSKLVKEIPDLSSDIIPRFYSNINEIEKHVSSSSERLLAKAPFSSSGRGLVWLPQNCLTRTERQILQGILKKQGIVSLEMVLDKKLDFAMEFMANGIGCILFVGYSLFFTNKKGAYECNLLASQSSLQKQISDNIDLCILDNIRECLCEILTSKFPPFYKGYIGVDMMLYEDKGELKIHPCVEINTRANMGILALNFSQNYLSSYSKGYLHLDYSPNIGYINKKHQYLKENNKAQFCDGKLCSGYFPLCPVYEESHYWAYVLAEENSI